MRRSFCGISTKYSLRIYCFFVFDLQIYSRCSLKRFKKFSGLKKSTIKFFPTVSYAGYANSGRFAGSTYTSVTACTSFAKTFCD